MYMCMHIQICIHICIFNDEKLSKRTVIFKLIFVIYIIIQSESFVKYKGAEIFPGTHIQTDDELDAYIRNVSSNNTHI
jgi:hypothetical protein